MAEAFPEDSEPDIYVYQYCNASVEQLIEAAKCGDLQKVKYQLRKNVDPNGRDNDSNQAIHYAARIDNVEIIDVLLEANNGLINSHGNSGYTPLHYAVQYTAVKTIEYLINKGANCNELNDENETPLHTVFNQFNECCFDKPGVNCKD
ncbi:ankyrin repeat domain-containing protein, partial [Wolbachia endosymbiont of Pentidionis agamae]|uniref:ankyrin repeat domain-containing protein n=1 Tax=Wolbachia endosymbiont of Pentidionis agamae TaxID=3110435 RepID=UPI002FCF0316